MKTRIITAIIGLIIVLPIIIYGNLPFIIVAFILALIGLFELIRMYKPNQIFVYMLFSVLFLIGLIYPLDTIQFFVFLLFLIDVILFLWVFFFILLLFIYIGLSQY